VQYSGTSVVNTSPQTAIEELQGFIAGNPDAREMRKALALKLIYQDYSYEAISQILDVSLGSISGWKQAYEREGLASLRLKHKGRISYLSQEQREAVLRWLQTKDRWEVGELEYHLAEQYDVVYESKQSYYDLFEAAGMSWKKTTKVNPKADRQAVEEKKTRFGGYWQATESTSKPERYEF
jgi:putative transposase